MIKTIKKSAVILLTAGGIFASGYIFATQQAKIHYLQKNLQITQAGIDLRTISQTEDAFLLATLALHEAGGEPIEGQQAVMEVALNRLKTGRWGESLREVIYAKKQFSYTAIAPEVLQAKEQLSEKQLQQLKLLAEKLLLGKEKLILPKTVLHFHAESVQPEWAKKEKAKKYKKIGNHIFYNF